MIEAVVVCVDYSDFLAWTLPYNRHQFDCMVVVTSTSDIKTQKLCEYWNVKCIRSDVCYENGEIFNKGKMINEGLKYLKGTEWIVHMDADIVLPPHFRRMFQCMDLDLDGLYTMDRLMCEDFEKWIKFLCQPDIQYENCIFVHNRPFPVGVRLASSTYHGYLPIGFFQMWHQGVHNFTYPIEHTSAARADLQFTLKFPRSHRHLMGECYCFHLETKIPGNNEMGQNWNGRKSPLFGFKNE